MNFELSQMGGKESSMNWWFLPIIGFDSFLVIDLILLKGEVLQCPFPLLASIYLPLFPH